MKKIAGCYPVKGTNCPFEHPLHIKKTKRRLKLSKDSNKTQTRLKQDSNKSLAKTKQDSNDNHAIKVVMLIRSLPIAYK